MKILSDKELYLEQSGFTPALRLDSRFTRRRAGIAVGLWGVLAAVCLFLTIFFLDQKPAVWMFLGGTEIFLGLYLLFSVYWFFLRHLEESKPLTLGEIKKFWEQEAYGRILNFSAARLLLAAGSSEDLLLGAFWRYVLAEPKFLWVWKRLNIPAKEFSRQQELRYPPAAALPLRELLLVSWQKALAGNHAEVTDWDILMAVFASDKIFQDLLFEFEVEEGDLQAVADWQRRREREAKTRSRFWTRENLLNTRGIGKDWSAGYTVYLDRFVLDLSASVRVNKPPGHLYGHKPQLEILERMLVRSAGSGNVGLVGEPGVGRHTLLRALAAKLNNGQTLGPLRYKRLLQIDTATVVAGAQSLNEVVERIETIFYEALRAENVILVVNDFDAFLDPHPEAGRVNATEALLPFLQSGLRIIGITTPQGYQATIGKNPQLMRLIAKLELSPPTPAQTLHILQDEVPRLERQSGLWFTHRALKEIVNLSEKLIQSLPNPEKSLEILQDAAVFVAVKLGERVVTAAHVQKVVTARTKVPVEKVAGEEKAVLLNLEEILHERIVNQQEAVQDLADALRRGRAGIASEKKPIGSFLFLGPTGVGKTETTKALARVYFGSEQRLIRFDMSEFQEQHSINRLLGDSDTGTGGLLTEEVIANPFSLVLLDEIEKAHPKILDLFLQVFDEGRLTDALGRSITFVNTMIVATSNAGAEVIREMIKAGKNPAAAREELLENLQRTGVFRPEFLNRFDAVVIFRPLSREELVRVATLLLQELNERLAGKEIQVKITPELAAGVATGGYSAEFGARPLRRYIQEHIENYLAKGLLSGEIQRGQVVEISPEILN